MATEQKDKRNIERGIEFKIEVKGLDTEREYIFTLYSERVNVTQQADVFVKEDDASVLVGVWSADKTLQMPISTYTLEIYNKEKTFFVEQEQFAYTSNNSLSKK